MKTGIALFVYNRPEHTKQVLEGLKKNNIKKLYIFADGIKKERDREKCQQVRELIDGIKWCEIEIIKSDKNKGLANSIIDGVNYILSIHERVIVLEDDCVPSSDFVTFVEKCFDKYENNEKIMSIAGYCYPIEIPKRYKYDVFFSHRCSSWGWATWKRSWKYFNKDYEVLRRIYLDEQLSKILNSVGNDLHNTLYLNLQGKVDSWATFWALNIIENKGLTIYPTRSLIKNVGFDSTGVHCNTTNEYDVDLYNINIKDIRFPDMPFIDHDISNQIKELFTNTSMEEKLKTNYNLSISWLEKLYNNKDLEDYIINNNINSIVIYGLGRIGNVVIKNKCITEKIRYIIDNNEKEKFKFDIPIFRLNDDLYVSEDDVVVVVPVYEFDSIKNSLEKHGFKKIISIREIIDSL